MHEYKCSSTDSKQDQRRHASTIGFVTLDYLEGRIQLCKCLTGLTFLTCLEDLQL